MLSSVANLLSRLGKIRSEEQRLIADFSLYPKKRKAFLSHFVISSSQDCFKFQSFENLDQGFERFMHSPLCKAHFRIPAMNQQSCRDW